MYSCLENTYTSKSGHDISKKRFKTTDFFLPFVSETNEDNVLTKKGPKFWPFGVLLKNVIFSLFLFKIDII